MDCRLSQRCITHLLRPFTRSKLRTFTRHLRLHRGCVRLQCPVSGSSGLWRSRVYGLVAGQVGLGCSGFQRLWTRAFSGNSNSFDGDIDKKIGEQSEEEEEDEEALWEARYSALFHDDYILPGAGHRVFVLQPDIKRGPDRAKLTTAELQMAEACALVDSLPGWSVVDKAIYTLRHRDKKHLYGRGNFEEITRRVVCAKRVTAVFVSLNMLSATQLTTMQESWNVPVYDRYTIVLQIFKTRARTREAKLQVALAEIPYFRSRLRGMHYGSLDLQRGGLEQLGGTGESYLELRQRILQERELKIRKALAAVKSQRARLRRERKKREFPIIAVVGYTNAGKTSLIKALTGSATMKPRDQLFATLDVTAHAGFLQGRMKVIYVDTVGFISNIPTTLIDSFAATLEDVLCATVILHVRDISHPDTEAQKANVIATLTDLQLPDTLRSAVIEVCNKVDLLPPGSQLEREDEDGRLYISAKTGEGLAAMTARVEEAVIGASDRVIRHLKIPTGGAHLSWLYKEASVRSAVPHDQDGSCLLVEAVMTQSAYAKFLARFGKKKPTA